MNAREEEERIDRNLVILNGVRRPIMNRVSELESLLSNRESNLISKGFYELRLEHARAEVDYLNRIIESEAWRR